MENSRDHTLTVTNSARRQNRENGHTGQLLKVETLIAHVRQGLTREKHNKACASPGIYMVHKVLPWLSKYAFANPTDTYISYG